MRRRESRSTSNTGSDRLVIMPKTFPECSTNFNPWHRVVLFYFSRRSVNTEIDYQYLYYSIQCKVYQYSSINCHLEYKYCTDLVEKREAREKDESVRICSTVRRPNASISLRSSNSIKIRIDIQNNVGHRTNNINIIFKEIIRLLV